MKLMTNNWKDRDLEVIVVDRLSGQPIEGAKVLLTKRASSTSGKDQILEKTSGKDGKLVFSQKDEDMKGFNTNVILKAELGDDKYMPKTSVYLNRNERRMDNDESTALQLLTDRSIYRPGQTVYVKNKDRQVISLEEAIKKLKKEQGLIVLPINKQTFIGGINHDNKRSYSGTS